MQNYGQELRYSVIVKLHALSLVSSNHSQLNLASLVTVVARSSIISRKNATMAMNSIEQFGDFEEIDPWRVSS